MADTILFSEKQRFTQWWIWLILLAVLAMPLFGLYHELRAKDPFANPENNTGLLLSLIVVLPIVALFIFMKLETQITGQGIYVKLFPVHLKFLHLPWSEMSEVYVRKYSPLSEFGGWGWRYGMAGKAYNVAGNQGIQIVFKNGKKLLIGTQKPEAAEAAIKQAQRVKA